MHTLLSLAFVLVISAGALAQPPNVAIQRKDIAYPKGLPAIGKWMIAPDGSYAHWLGASYQGKKLREPINIILRDSFSKSAEEARVKLEKACAQSGYEKRRGHSGGHFWFYRWAATSAAAVRAGPRVLERPV